jgi:hypothetical protein
MNFPGAVVAEMSKIKERGADVLGYTGKAWDKTM